MNRLARCLPVVVKLKEAPLKILKTCDDCFVTRSEISGIDEHPKIDVCMIVRGVQKKSLAGEYLHRKEITLYPLELEMHLHKPIFSLLHLFPTILLLQFHHPRTHQITLIVLPNHVSSTMNEQHKLQGRPHHPHAGTSLYASSIPRRVAKSSFSL